MLAHKSRSTAAFIDVRTVWILAQFSRADSGMLFEKEEQAHFPRQQAFISGTIFEEVRLH